MIFSSFNRDDRRWYSGMRLLGLGILLFTCFSSFVGCSGCRNEDPIAKQKRLDEEKKKAEEEKARKEKEKPKPDFEMVGVEIFPSPFKKIQVNDTNDNKEKEKEGKENASGDTRQDILIKPGHWGTSIVYWRSNNADFSGHLKTFYGKAKEPADIERTNFRFDSLRHVVLTKGQAKGLEASFFAPRRAEEDGALGQLRSELLARRFSSGRADFDYNCRSIGSHEYFFIVLSAIEGRYAFLSKNDDTFPAMCMRPENDLDGALRLYHVQTPSIKNRIPLSEHSLAWTSIAVVLLDDIDPTQFSAGQQIALLDWLHWGGQLLISGPQSLDRLKGSFLEPYLPASAGESRKLDLEALAEMNNYWSIGATKNSDRDQPKIQVAPDKPIVGVTLLKTEGSDFIPHTGELVAERRVGHGRIVVTSFPMADFRIQNWRSYDGFFNGCLLRHPGRDFYIPSEPSAPGFSSLNFSPTFRWQLVSQNPSAPEKKLTRLPEDPRIVSTLRYFTRDSGLLDEERLPQKLPPLALSKGRVDSNGNPTSKPLSLDDIRGRRWWEYDFSSDATSFDDWHFAGAEGTPASGIASWNDFSGAANAARDTLRDAAGIRIPNAKFVMQVLGVYLLVLVPVNWLIFWLMGRVEWAWACAPLISILGAFAVIRLAQLDIGFAYSRTEVAILETQGTYNRGHLTRFTTLYTSLSSAYRLEFDDPSAQSLPFSTDPDFQVALGRSTPTCSLERENKVRLSNIQVQSNSTGTVRSEHMVGLEEGLVLTGNDASGYQLKNGTEFTLNDIGLLRRTSDTHELQGCYIAELPPGISQKVQFSKLKENAIDSLWSESSVMNPNPTTDAEPGVIRLGRIVKVSTSRMKLLPGDVRLLGWTEDEMPGLTITPTAPQNQTRTLVLSHLQQGAFPEPQRDLNVYRDIRPEREIFDGTTTDLNATSTSFKTEQGPLVP